MTKHAHNKSLAAGAAGEETGGGHPTEGAGAEDGAVPLPERAATIRILVVVTLTLIYIREIMAFSQAVEAGHLVPQLATICLAVLLALIGEHIVYLSVPSWRVSPVRPIALGGFLFAAVILALGAIVLEALSYEAIWVSVLGIAVTSIAQLVQIYRWRRSCPKEGIDPWENAAWA